MSLLYLAADFACQGRGIDSCSPPQLHVQRLLTGHLLTQAPLQQRIVWPSENFTFSLKSLFNRMGTLKRKCVTRFQASLKGRHLCWTWVWVWWWMDTMEASSFIYGVNCDRVVSISVGNRNCLGKSKQENVAFLLNLPSQYNISPGM